MVSLYLARKDLLNFCGIATVWAISLFGSLRLGGFIFGKGGFYPSLIVLGAMFIVALVLSRLFFGRRLTRGKFVDYLSISALIAPAVYLVSPALFGLFDAKVVHGSLLLAIIFVLSFFGRSTPSLKRPFDKVGLSLAVAFGAIALWTSPYFTLPAYIGTEYNLVVLLAAVFAFCLIWRENNLSKHGVFVASIVAVLVQFSDIMKKDHQLFDALFLGTVMAGVLLLSFFLKKRRWFVLSAITLGVFTVYLTRDFWASIRWWVYLLVCGVAMIIAAAVYEYRRRSGKTLKSDSAKGEKGEDN
jgi:hypothetical protein